MYYLYFLFSPLANKFYIGHSNDPWKRLEQHLTNSGNKYTGSYTDWELVAIYEVSAIKGDADRIEKFIKQQKSRSLIERMVSAGFVGTGPLSQLVRVPHVRD